MSAAIVLALLVGPGCGSGSDAVQNELGQGQTSTFEASGGTTKATVEAEGSHFAQGRNVFLVSFQPSSTELVSVSAFMPAHGHGVPAEPTIAAVPGGYRVSNAIFSMPGLWRVTFDVSVAGRSDTVEFSVDVP